MKKSLINLAVDLLSLVLLGALTSTGLILQWKLPAGSGRVSGPEGAEHAINLLWGWDRHEWGQLHFAVSVGLLALLSVHVALHWKWVVAMCRGKGGAAKEPRALLGVVGLALLLVTLLMPLWSKPRTVARGQVELERQTGAIASTNPPQNGGWRQEAIYQKSCAGCHGSPSKLPSLDLSWTGARLFALPPAGPHQALEIEELEKVLNYVRAVQLTNRSDT